MRPAEEAFSAFVASRERRLQQAAWLLTGDWWAAEDLVQSALAKAWRHWDRVVRADDPDAYVRRVLANTFATGLRRRWRGELVTATLPDGPVGGELEAETASRLTVQAALSRLPPRQRVVVVLRFVDDLSERQVAAVLGCAVGTVKSTTAKALERLRADPDVAELLKEVSR